MKSQQSDLCLQDGVRQMGRLIVDMEMTVRRAGSYFPSLASHFSVTAQPMLAIPSNPWCVPLSELARLANQFENGTRNCEELALKILHYVHFENGLHRFEEARRASNGSSS